MGRRGGYESRERATKLVEGLDNRVWTEGAAVV